MCQLTEDQTRAKRKSGSIADYKAVLNMLEWQEEYLFLTSILAILHYSDFSEHYDYPLVYEGGIISS